MSEYPYTVKFTSEERQRYDNLAKKHGYKTLSKLIRLSLDSVERNPALLEPTENQTSKEILEKMETSFSVFDQLNATLEAMNERLASLERFQEWTVQKLGATRKDLKQIQKKDTSGDVIFDE